VTRNHKANLGLIGMGGILCLSALVGLVLATVSAGTLVWPMLLFEPIVLGGGLVMLAVGLGLQKNSVPMALATAVGCVFVAGFLSTVAGRNTLGSTILVPMLGIRMVIVLVVAIQAAWLVLGPDAHAWKRLVLGAVLLAIGAGIAAIGFIGPAKPVRDYMLSMGGFIASAIALVLFIVFLVLVSAGVHLVVRPFEIAAASGNPEDRPAA